MKANKQFRSLCKKLARHFKLGTLQGVLHKYSTVTFDTNDKATNVRHTEFAYKYKDATYRISIVMKDGKCREYSIMDCLFFTGTHDCSACVDSSVCLTQLYNQLVNSGSLRNDQGCNTHKKGA